MSRRHGITRVLTPAICVSAAMKRRPVFALRGEHGAAAFGDAVIAPAALARLFDPSALDQRALLEPIERGVERRHREMHRAVRSQLDLPPDLVAVVIRFVDEREDEEIGAAFLGGVIDRRRLRPQSSSSFVIYRKAVYQTGANCEKVGCAGALARRRQAGRSQPDTRFARRDVFVTGAREFRPEFAGTRLALTRAHDQRSAICVARVVEESDHDARRHARAGARHRRHDDDVRVVECGGVAAACRIRSRIASSSCGATSSGRSSSAAARRSPITSIGRRRASRSTLMSAWSDAQLHPLRQRRARAPDRRNGRRRLLRRCSASSRWLGRALTSADDAVDAPLVAVIGERLWERAFGRRPDAIGKSIQLNNQVFTIVGVAPARFKGRSDASEVWVSMIASMPPRGASRVAAAAASPRWRGSRRACRSRRRKRTSPTSRKQLAQAYPDTNEKRGVEVSPLANEVFGQIRPAISLLFGAVAFVLVIACASVASLLLARTESRRREFSLRRAIGADERRLIRLMLSESAWVVALGGTAGVLLSMWAGDALLALSPVQLPSFAAPGVDWRTLAFVARPRRVDHRGDRPVAAAIDGQAFARAGSARRRDRSARRRQPAARCRRSSRARSR